MKRIILLLIIVISVTGCQNNELEEKNDSKANDEVIILSENKEASQEMYFDYLKNQYDLEDDMEIKIFIEESLTSADEEHVIVGLGPISAQDEFMEMDKIYVLSSLPEIHVIDEIKLDYASDVLKIVKLKGSEKKYIYCGLTNMINVYGFDLYELVNSELVLIRRDVSGGGAGISELFDSNEDGYFEGYNTYRAGIGMLYYETEKNYLWQDEAFVLNVHKVYLPQYPESAKDVVLQYISLQAINEKSEDIDKRLKEININQETYDKSVIDFKDLSHYLLEFNDTLHMDEETYDDYKIIILSSGSDAVSSPYTYTFKMEEISEQWIISAIDLKLQ